MFLGNHLISERQRIIIDFVLEYGKMKSIELSDVKHFILTRLEFLCAAGGKLLLIIVILQGKPLTWDLLCGVQFSAVTRTQITCL